MQTTLLSRRAAPALLAAGLGACSLVAPFGDLRTGDVDGGTARTDGGMCLTRPMPPMEEPLPSGMGAEVCNREDDDADGLVDEDLLVVEAVRAVPMFRAALDARGMRGGGDDRLAVVATLGEGVVERLAIAEIYLADGVDPLVSTLLEGEVGGFDGARVRDGYAIAFALGGDVRFGVARDCDLSFGGVITIASGSPSHVRVEAVTPLSVLVTWEAAGGEIGVALVDVREGPRVDVMHPNALADVGLSMGRDPDAWVDGSGNAQVAFAARDGEGFEGVYFRTVGGALGGLTTAARAGGFFGDAPFTDPHGATSSTGAMWIVFDQEPVAGSAFVTGSAITARRYGPPAEVLGLAASDTPDVGILLDFAGRAVIERVGPEAGGSISRDSMPPSLGAERWRDLVGVPRGRTRYVALGTRGGGALVMQRVGCFD
ncbi:MAG: hypothetical protein KF729_09315 [Sandaracinaceae bacterium]|nr:hypothetical protein [Sandaracinaceae bacterium]